MESAGPASCGHPIPPGQESGDFLEELKPDVSDQGREQITEVKSMKSPGVYSERGAASFLVRLDLKGQGTEGGRTIPRFAEDLGLGAPGAG